MISNPKRRLSSRAIQRLTIAFAAIALAAGVAIALIVIVGDDEVEAPPTAGGELVEPLETEENRRVQLPLPQPETFERGTAERALAEFLDAWHDRRFARMWAWTAADAGPDTTQAWLEQRYGPLLLFGWTIRDRAPLPGDAVRYRIAAAVQRQGDVTIERRRLEFRVARGETGRWGVDPLPPLREEPPESE